MFLKPQRVVQFVLLTCLGATTVGALYGLKYSYDKLLTHLVQRIKLK